MAAGMTVREPIPTSMARAATTRPATVFGTWSPYPTVVTVCTAHQSPDPIDGKLWRSAPVIRRPAPTLIEVDTAAITTPPPRGLRAGAKTGPGPPSSLVSSVIRVEFVVAGARPAASGAADHRRGDSS